MGFTGVLPWHSLSPCQGYLLLALGMLFFMPMPFSLNCISFISQLNEVEQQVLLTSRSMHFSSLGIFPLNIHTRRENG